MGNTNSNIWKHCKREIEECEKKLIVESAVKKRGKKFRWKAEAKKRNAHKIEI